MTPALWFHHTSVALFDSAVHAPVEMISERANVGLR
jgi:hypothetical protein